MNIQDQNSLVFTFMNYLTAGSNFITKLDEILNEENFTIRMKKIRQLREFGFSLTNKKASFFKIALFAIFLGQIVLAFLFAKYYNWTFG